MQDSAPIAGTADDKLKLWLPTILWLIALFVLSTSLFSAANTSKVIIPILRFLLPDAPGLQLRCCMGSFVKQRTLPTTGFCFGY